jgi:hypothetical protein
LSIATSFWFDVLIEVEDIRETFVKAVEEPAFVGFRATPLAVLAADFTID